MEEDQERKKFEQSILQIFLLKWAQKKQPIFVQELDEFYWKKTGVSSVPYADFETLGAFLKTKPEWYTQSPCGGWIPSLRNCNGVNNSVAVSAGTLCAVELPLNVSKSFLPPIAFIDVTQPPPAVFMAKEQPKNPQVKSTSASKKFPVLQFPVGQWESIGQWEPIGHKETSENFSKPEELLPSTSSRNQNLNLQLVIEDISGGSTKKKKRNKIAPSSSRFKLCGLECKNYIGPMSKSAAKSTPNSYANSLSLSTWSGWEDISEQNNLNSTQQENEESDSSNNQSEAISQEETEKENDLSDQVQRSSENLNETPENHLQTESKLDECPLSTISSQNPSDKDNYKQKNDDKPNLLKEILEPVWGRTLTREEMKIFDKVRQNKEEEEKHFRSLLEKVKLSLAKSSNEKENKPNESDKCNGLCPCCCKKDSTR